MRLATGTRLDGYEILGPIGELVAAPGQQEDVFGGAQFQQRRFDVRDAKNDKARRGPLHQRHLGALGGSSSYGSAINNSGTVVGLSTIQNGSYHAFISTNGRRMQDLNNLIPAQTGWVLQEGAAINDTGQIAGYGTLNGQLHAFLLTPAQ
jgi:probable HAF family extracellular repeat protein